MNFGDKNKKIRKVLLDQAKDPSIPVSYRDKLPPGKPQAVEKAVPFFCHCSPATGIQRHTDI